MIRWLRSSFPVVAAVVAFLGVAYLVTQPRGPSGTPAVLSRTLRGAVERDLPLQVAVHDLIESAQLPTRIRICRALANRTIVLDIRDGENVSAVLDNLAGQVGAHVALTVRQLLDPAEPTILCPDSGVADYLTIGPNHKQ